MICSLKAKRNGFSSLPPSRPSFPREALGCGRRVVQTLAGQGLQGVGTDGWGCWVSKGFLGGGEAGDGGWGQEHPAGSRCPGPPFRATGLKGAGEGPAGARLCSDPALAGTLLGAFGEEAAPSGGPCGGLLGRGHLGAGSLRVRQGENSVVGGSQHGLSEDRPRPAHHVARSGP